MHESKRKHELLTFAVPLLKATSHSSLEKQTPSDRLRPRNFESAESIVMHEHGLGPWSLPMQSANTTIHLHGSIAHHSRPN